MLLLKWNFLLFWHLVNGSRDLLAHINIDDDDGVLTKAAINITTKVCNNLTVNFIYLKHSQTLDNMIKLASRDAQNSVQIESTNYLNYTPIAPKWCNIFVITSLNDFAQIYDTINPLLFNYRRHFLIVSLKRLPPAQNEQIFQLLWKKFILRVNLIAFDHQTMEVATVTTFFPFKAHACDDTRPVVVNYFKNGEFLNSTDRFMVDKLRNMQECPLRIVTASRSEPYLIIESDGNETKFRGRDANLIQTIASSLNFRLKIIVLEDKGFLLENGSSGGMFKYLANGSADLALNDLWITRLRKKFFDVTAPYYSDDLIFVIPAMDELRSIEKLIYPFSTELWVVLIGCLIVGYVVILIAKHRSKAIQNFIFGRNVKNQFLNVWIALLGSTQRPLPRRNFARFILMAFLILSLVIRTAYQAALFQFMQTDRKHKEPQTFNDLLERDYNFMVIPLNMDLIEQFEGLKKRITLVNTKQRDEALKATLSPASKNAVVISKAVVLYRNQQNAGKNQLRICKERLMMITSAMYTPKDSFLIAPINRRIFLLQSAGLIQYWQSLMIDKNFQHSRDSKAPRVLKLRHLSGSFHLLAIGHFVALLAFLGELLKRKIFERHH